MTDDNTKPNAKTQSIPSSVNPDAEPNETTSGYPIDELLHLQHESVYLFEENVKRFGEGKNWLEDEARWHIWKACDELFQMRDHAHGEADYDNTLRTAGDALNHMLFALEIARLNDESACDPSFNRT